MSSLPYKKTFQFYFETLYTYRQNSKPLFKRREIVFLQRIKQLNGILSQKLSCVFENLIPHVSSSQAHVICLYFKKVKARVSSFL